jgi:hypothetical protein
MRALRSGALVLLLLALALTRAPAEGVLPANPHQPMSATEACAGCHAYYNGTLDPHGFVVEIQEICAKCHAPKDLGRSHPVGVDPRSSPTTITVPAELPLENGKVSCGSCHNPHMAFLSTTRVYRDQKVTFLQWEGRVEIPWYKTIFLRKSDPIKGFEPLCVACHKDY